MYRPSQYLKYIVDPTRIVSIDHYKFIPGGSVTSLLDECDHINVLLISVFTRSFYIQGLVYPTSVPLQDAMDRDLVHVWSRVEKRKSLDVTGRLKCTQIMKNKYDHIYMYILQAYRFDTRMHTKLWFVWSNYVVPSNVHCDAGRDNAKWTCGTMVVRRMTSCGPQASLVCSACGAALSVWSCETLFYGGHTRRQARLQRLV